MPLIEEPDIECRRVRRGAGLIHGCIPWQPKVEVAMATILSPCNILAFIMPHANLNRIQLNRL